LDADGYRLPTEAEWEYAARKTSKGFQRGDSVSGVTGGLKAENLAWYDANSTGTHVIGTAGNAFTDAVPGTGNANAAGIFDMSGNVLEYCWDWYADYTAGSAENTGSGPAFGDERVSRGGSWSAYAGFVYAGDRYSFDPNEAYDYMGFRIVTSR
jgi:formylglycine-generating enzyme required for sulfatase activity